MIKDKNKILFSSCGEISEFTFTAGRANYLPKWAKVRLTVIVPGSSVEELSIREVAEGGLVHE